MWILYFNKHFWTSCCSLFHFAIVIALCARCSIISLPEVHNMLYHRCTCIYIYLYIYILEQISQLGPCGQRKFSAGRPAQFDKISNSAGRAASDKFGWPRGQPNLTPVHHSFIIPVLFLSVQFFRYKPLIYIH